MKVGVCVCLSAGVGVGVGVRAWIRSVCAGAGRIARSLLLGCAALALPGLGAAGGADIELLHAFSGAHGGGVTPLGALVQSPDGGLYGATQSGGENGSGTIFRVLPDKTFQTVTGFELLEGRGPVGDLVADAAGNLHGMTHSGGDFDGGTIFVLAPDGSKTVLYSFDPGGWGGHPVAGLARAADGTLFGVIPDNQGPAVLFELSASGQWSPRAVLSTPCFGFNSRPILDADGSVYVASQSLGCVLRVDTTTGKVTILHKFSNEQVTSVILGADGNLYGTFLGGPNHRVCGGVYRLDVTGGASTVHAFPCSPFGTSNPGLVQSSDGLLHGSAVHSRSGKPSKNTVFSVATDGSSFSETRLPPQDGQSLFPLIQGTDGALYGAGYAGRRYGVGTLVRITP